jgi:hypothetical protein
MTWRLPRSGWMILTAILITVAGAAIYLWQLHRLTQPIIDDVASMKGQTIVNYVGPSRLADWLDEHDKRRILQWFKLNLVGLDVNNPAVDDAWLLRLRPCSRLRSLGLQNCPITDTGVRSMLSLPELLALDLDETQTTDAGLESLKSLKHLRSISLSKTPITDQGMHSLASYPALQSLELLDTQVTDKGVAALKSSRNLARLELSGPHITDACLPDLAAIPTLKKVDLYGPTFTPAGIERLQKLRPDMQVNEVHP